MGYWLRRFFVFILLLAPSNVLCKDLTLKELFFDESKPYHLKILDKTNNQVVRSQTNLISGFDFYPTDLDGAIKFFAS